MGATRAIDAIDRGGQLLANRLRGGRLGGWAHLEPVLFEQGLRLALNLRAADDFRVGVIANRLAGREEYRSDPACFFYAALEER